MHEEASYAQPAEAPLTPVLQTTPMFPPLSRSNSVSSNGTVCVSVSRRVSVTGNYPCSSSSSLYENSLHFDDEGTEDHCMNSSFGQVVYSTDEETHDEGDETDTDAESNLDIISRINSRNTPNTSGPTSSLFKMTHDLFSKKNCEEELSGTKSPTFSKSKKGYDYFSSPKESTPIFKRLVSKNALKPQLKSFKRITNELQHESVPLENEINHEKLILLNLQNEEDFSKNMNHRSLLQKNSKTIEQQNHSYKKFDIVKKANESWNLRKHSNIESSDKKGGIRKQLEAEERSLRKRSFESDSEPKYKRRAVSSSPVSIGVVKRANVKVVSKTSSELEKMSLD